MQLLGGAYLLGAAIGSGGMGVVHLATQPALQRQVAIKILHRELVANPAMVEHFRREALIASQVTHPNLVTIFDVGEQDDGTPFLVMELVPGRPLGDLVRERVFSIAQAVQITRQVLAALAATHRSGVVHADVKSDNVLLHVAPDGSERIKLIDFGLACLGGCSDKATDDDGHPMVAGTPDFMAPEVIRGQPPAAAADLYGAGAMLYELLTGATPFAGDTPAEIMTRHLCEPVIPPSLRRPDRGIGRALDDVVLRALAKDPAVRFRDADEMSCALHAAAASAAAPCWCHACGGARSGDTDRCPACGATVAVAPAPYPFGHDLVTQVHRRPSGRQAPRRWRSQRMAATVVDEERRLRAAIGQAIRKGALPAMAEAYRALARHLAGRGHVLAAEAELREGLDIVTEGGAATTFPLGAYGLKAELDRLHALLVARHSDDKPTLTEVALRS